MINKLLEKLRRKIEALFKEAGKKALELARKYLQKFFRESEDLIHRRENGEIEDRDYQRWLQTSVFSGDWDTVSWGITDIYTDADKQSRKATEDTKKDVFVVTANETAQEMAKDHPDEPLNLYDRPTVDRLVNENPQILPEWKIDEAKDYIWNAQRVRDVVTQGITRGESVQKIAERLGEALSSKNANKMQMFARTAITGAENAGRIARMEEMDKKYGIVTQKKWMSCQDHRVRNAHKPGTGLDGQVRRYDEPFVVPNDGRTIRYPGDPTAAPDLVYNCRCTLLYVRGRR